MRDICIIATGGTINKVHDHVSEKLILSDEDHSSELLKQCRAENIPHSVLMMKDSLDMDDNDREAIRVSVVNRPEEAIVITHGTSTMSETSEYLLSHFEDSFPDKAIVLTGAMRPFSLFKSDAGFNLGCAIMVARLAGPGVYLTMNGRIFNAGEVIKNVAEGYFERI